MLKVDRSPVTFIWENKTGIKVESRDSIGFTVGINISAFVAESDTSLFLYNFPAGNIRRILQDIVKSKATEVLSREFAKYDLEGESIMKHGKKIEITKGARQQKGVIVDLAKKELIAFFENSGVTITTFGLIGGLAYDDDDIQKAINDNFASELDIKNKANIRLAQEEINAKNIGIAAAEKTAAEHFAKAAVARKKQAEVEISLMRAKAELTKAEKWDGKLPANIMPEGSGFIMNMNNKK